MTDWKHTTNIYEVNVRQYTKEGTFKAFQKNYQDSKNGVKHFGLCQLHHCTKREKGSLGSPYAAQDYTSINPEFGTLDDFKKFSKRSSQNGFQSHHRLGS